MKMLIVLFILFFCASAQAQNEPYKTQLRTDFTTKENLINFGVVYGAQWTYYLIDQNAIINERASFKNWSRNPFSPHFDNDSFDYNIFNHSITGSFYYQWYRSRGHSQLSAFSWTFLSSLVFEFTIETLTERPSYQDIYQTPVYGTILGVGLENLSLYFHKFDTWYGHALGYLFNPFTLVPSTKPNSLSAAPYFDRDMVGAKVSYRF